MEKPVASSSRRSPFWACLVVFAMLAVDGGLHFLKLSAQRRQIAQAQVVQAQNAGRLAPAVSQQPQIEARLQALSLELVQIAKTNNTARQIVQEFNIQWSPGAAPEPTPAAK